jgi:hypothetical protein
MSPEGDPQSLCLQVHAGMLKDSDISEKSENVTLGEGTSAQKSASGSAPNANLWAKAANWIPAPNARWFRVNTNGNANPRDTIVDWGEITFDDWKNILSFITHNVTLEMLEWGADQGQVRSTCVDCGEACGSSQHLLVRQNDDLNWEIQSMRNWDAWVVGHPTCPMEQILEHRGLFPIPVIQREYALKHVIVRYIPHLPERTPTPDSEYFCWFEDNSPVVVTPVVEETVAPAPISRSQRRECREGEINWYALTPGNWATILAYFRHPITFLVRERTYQRHVNEERAVLEISCDICGANQCGSYAIFQLHGSRGHMWKWYEGSPQWNGYRNVPPITDEEFW